MTAAATGSGSFVRLASRMAAMRSIFTDRSVMSTFPRRRSSGFLPDQRTYERHPGKTGFCCLLHDSNARELPGSTSRSALQETRFQDQTQIQRSSVSRRLPDTALDEIV